MGKAQITRRSFIGATAIAGLAAAVAADAELTGLVSKPKRRLRPRNPKRGL